MTEAVKAKKTGQEAASNGPGWRRTLWRALLLLLFVGLIGGGAMWGVQKLRDPQLLPLKVVQIDGSFQHLKREDVRRVLVPHLQRGFFAIDVAAIQAAAEQLPWVDRASVRLIWPDTLRLSVTEQVPLARWRQDRLLNTRGEIFQPAEVPSELPLFAGPDGSELEVVRRFKELNARLRPLGLVVEKIALDARRAWTLQVSNGLIVRLGKKDIEMRLARFFRIYPRLQREKLQLQEVDLRYTNGFAIRKKAAGGEDAPPKAGIGSVTTVSSKRGLA